MSFATEEETVAYQCREEENSKRLGAWAVIDDILDSADYSTVDGAPFRKSNKKEVQLVPKEVEGYVDQVLDFLDDRVALLESTFVRQRLQLVKQESAK